MSRNKFGSNGTNVENFFREVSANEDVSAWRKVLERYDARSRVRTILASREAGLSASVSSAIEKAEYTFLPEVIRSDADIPEAPRSFEKLTSMIGLAAVALAQGANLPPEHRATALAPFAEAGFTSVLVGMPDEDGQNDE